MIECLQVYISMGWPLFPCHAQGPKAKAPFTEHGFKNASLDWKQIEAWHQQFPDCAWGVATSADRCVLDIDINKGGSESLAKLIAEHGQLPLRNCAKITWPYSLYFFSKSLPLITVTSSCHWRSYFGAAPNA